VDGWMQDAERGWQRHMNKFSVSMCKRRACQLKEEHIRSESVVTTGSGQVLSI